MSDNNTGDGDGCSSICTVEDGWECAGGPSTYTVIPVPAVSAWGLLVMASLVLIAGAIVIQQRRQLM